MALLNRHGADETRDRTKCASARRTAQMDASPDGLTASALGDVSASVPTAVIDRVTLRGLPAHLAMLCVALVVALAAEVLNSAALYGVLAAAIAIGLVPTRKAWVGRRSGKIALVLAVGAILGTLAMGGDLVRIAAAASRMSDVIILILCVALIRPALAELKLDHAIAAMIALVPRPLRGCAVLLGVTIAGLGLSFGAVSVFGGSLRARTDDDAAVARAAMRGLSLSMILGPSPASVAAVMATFPGVGWGEALMVGLPIAFAGVVIGSFEARRSEERRVGEE